MTGKKPVFFTSNARGILSAGKKNRMQLFHIARRAYLLRKSSFPNNFLQHPRIIHF
jgi:hypothetical protein